MNQIEKYYLSMKRNRLLDRHRKPVCNPITVPPYLSNSEQETFGKRKAKPGIPKFRFTSTTLGSLPNYSNIATGRQVHRWIMHHRQKDWTEDEDGNFIRKSSTQSQLDSYKPKFKTLSDDSGIASKTNTSGTDDMQVMIKTFQRNGSDSDSGVECKGSSLSNGSEDEVVEKLDKSEQERLKIKVAQWRVYKPKTDEMQNAQRNSNKICKINVVSTAFPFSTNTSVDIDDMYGMTEKEKMAEIEKKVAQWTVYKPKTT